jgi:hypothetical protein
MIGASLVLAAQSFMNSVCVLFSVGTMDELIATRTIGSIKMLKRWFYFERGDLEVHHETEKEAR